MKNNKGFSLVELIVVIAIMAILAAVAIPTFASFITKANVASDVSFINDLTYAAELAHTATGDKIIDVNVTVDAEGKVTAASYTLDRDTDVTITVDVATKKASDGGDANAVSDVEKAAEDMIKTIEWDYKFKSTKAAGTYIISGDEVVVKPAGN